MVKYDYKTQGRQVIIMRKIKRLGILFCICLVTMLMVPCIATDSSARVTAQAATKVKLNKSKVYVIKGEYVQLKMIGTKKKVKWSSSNKNVASVNSKGKVKGVKKGTANIYAKVNDKKYSCKIVVETPKLSKSKVTVNKGKTVTLSMKSTKQKVKWSSSDKKIATVSSKGVVKGVSSGKTTIVAKVGSKKYK